MAVQEPDELDVVEEKIQQRLDSARAETFAWTLFLGLYVWLGFSADFLNYLGEVLKQFLPPFFATWNSIGIFFGVGSLIGHRALYGKSWFDKFHLDETSRILKPHRGILCGTIIFVLMLNYVIAFFWLIGSAPTFDLSLWIIIPLFLIGSVVSCLAIIPIGRILGVVLKAKVF